jgi:acetylornithine/N-succinyldiaminopimelate aminotransferase
MNLRQLFLQHNGQTSSTPLCFEIEKANGIYLYDAKGRKYFDAIGGISVANIGHSHPKVLKAIEEQASKYLHTMVYGEMVQTPQVLYAKALCEVLPKSLNSVFFANSGAEAIEGAMKLAKRVTQRTNFIAFKKSYHGSTQGALSLIGDEYWRNAYRPLLPNVFHYDYNNEAVLAAINEKTAAVFVEPVQAESGVYAAQKEWLQALADKCKTTGTLLVFDESQTGFGRTGHVFALDGYGIVPDILVLAKAIGGGLPLGAFIADQKLMHQLADAPILGHISTFAGHPLSCAAGLAAFKVLQEEKIVESIHEKKIFLEKAIQNIGIECYRIEGLWAALFFKDYPTTKKIVDACIDAGVFTDWFLFASNALRISPPLTISIAELEEMFLTIDKITRANSTVINK